MGNALRFVCVVTEVLPCWTFQPRHPEDFPNLLTGTFGNQRERSTGNTLPIVALPWGFNHWAPQSTSTNGSWWFDGHADTFEGIRCTHQPSPWIGDYAWFVINPEDSDNGKKTPWIAYTSFRSAVLRPYLMDLTLGPHGIRVELSPTMHGAITRVTFPPSLALKERRVCASVPANPKSSDFDEVLARTKNLTTGFCQSHADGMMLVTRRIAGGVPSDSSFGMYAYIEASNANVRQMGERKCCFIVSSSVCEIRVATSFISVSQARRALDYEIGNKSFSDIVNNARTAWHDILNRIEVIDAGQPEPATWKRLEMFYTCLYRVLLFPRRLDENTPEGVYHWSPYDGNVHSGPGVTDHGFWDAFRTVYPLLALAYVEELGEIIQGWLNAFRVGGWLPKWASPGYRGAMPGTFADVVVADAIIKNISGFDQDLAWKALLKEAFEETADGAFGKESLKSYIKLGYVPLDEKKYDACSQTLDFAFSDAATASVASKLGYIREESILRTRSVRALKELYSKKTGLMSRKFKSGRMVDMHAKVWGEGYMEGSAWHHSFPPFNLSALAELHGGRQTLLTRLRKVLDTPAEFSFGTYDAEIHEMREMRLLGLGQYAHNNQPMHHFPYLFAALGDHTATSKLVRQTLARAYSSGGFSGDEDNGEMGAWYVLSAMGLFAIDPGVTDRYVFGAIPLFPKMYIRDLRVSINARSAEQDWPLVSEIRWDTQAIESESISYSTLRKGGVVEFISPADALRSDEQASACLAEQENRVV